MGKSGFLIGETKGDGQLMLGHVLGSEVHDAVGCPIAGWERAGGGCWSMPWVEMALLVGMNVPRIRRAKVNVAMGMLALREVVVEDGAKDR